MSKKAAIDYAVRRQLALDGKPPHTYREIMKEGQAPAAQPNQVSQLVGQLPAAADLNSLKRQVHEILQQLNQQIQALDQKMREMAPGHPGYTQSSMLTFLAEVSDQLRLDVPSRTCKWAELDLQRCIEAPVKELERLIEEKTSSGGDDR